MAITKMAASSLIEDQIEKRNIRTDDGVDELYLAKCNLKDVCSLERFRQLNRLWVNHNLLRSVKFLPHNYRLTELYLDNNLLADLSGCIRHLDCLQVLTLHNNQLTDLTRVLGEFKHMQWLSRLSLAYNSVAQEVGYRLFVIHSIPSLETLDWKLIRKEERNKAARFYKSERHEISSKVSFLRRSVGPPEIAFPRQAKVPPTIPRENVCKNYLSMCPMFNSTEEAAVSRRTSNSVNIFTVVDWRAMPREEERRLKPNSHNKGHLLTHVYR